MMKKGAIERLKSIIVLVHHPKLLNSPLCSEQFYLGKKVDSLTKGSPAVHRFSIEGS